MTVMPAGRAQRGRARPAHWLGLPVPQHVAFLMDGNRRWAREHGYASASVGHRVGAAHAEDVLAWCARHQIRILTLFVASVDNLRKRDPREVSYIMSLIETFTERLATQDRWEVRLAGRMNELPPSTTATLRRACEASAGKERPFRLYIAIGYDGRAEIIDAANTLLANSCIVSTQEDAGDLITTGSISRALYTGADPDPELVVRTSGERRLSTFMPWQTAHSELYFCRSPWPAFSYRDFRKSLWAYRRRHLRQRLTSWAYR